jgi:hypothetical protein
MMGCRYSNKLAGGRNCPNPHEHPRSQFPPKRIISMRGSRIAAVGKASPHMVSNVGVAIHVVPTCIDDHPLMSYAGMPFVGFVEAERLDKSCIGIQHMQGIHRAMPPAPKKSAPSHGDESYPIIRQDTGIKLIPRTIRQLFEL